MAAAEGRRDPLFEAVEGRLHPSGVMLFILTPLDHVFKSSVGTQIATAAKSQRGIVRKIQRE